MKRILFGLLAMVLAFSMTTSSEARGPRRVVYYGNDYVPYVVPYYPYYGYTTGYVPYVPYGPVIAPAEAFGFGPYFRY